MWMHVCRLAEHQVPACSAVSRHLRRVLRRQGVDLRGLLPRQRPGRLYCGAQQTIEAQPSLVLQVNSGAFRCRVCSAAMFLWCVCKAFGALRCMFSMKLVVVVLCGVCPDPDVTAPRSASTRARSKRSAPARSKSDASLQQQDQPSQPAAGSAPPALVTPPAPAPGGYPACSSLPAAGAVPWQPGCTWAAPVPPMPIGWQPVSAVSAAVSQASPPVRGPCIRLPPCPLCRLPFLSHTAHSGSRPHKTS
jgi:hypothetical protein